MNSIRNKIQNALIMSISIISFCSIFILSLNQAIVSRNQKTIEIITTEYDLITQTNNLVQTYNVVVKNSNDEKSLAVYTAQRTKLLNDIVQLKTQISSPDSQTVLIGVQNTINKVIEECDTGIQEVKNNDFSNISTHFSQANKNNDFVKQNTQKLIQTELQYLSTTQDRTKQISLMGTLISAVFFVLIVLIMVLYSSSFSKKLVLPIQKLIETTQHISEGNMDVEISQDLVNQKDETGILANSFVVMLNTIKKNISELKSFNEELVISRNAADASKNAFEKTNTELEKLNSFMTNRELKMIELKKQIAELTKTS